MTCKACGVKYRRNRMVSPFLISLGEDPAAGLCDSCVWDSWAWVNRTGNTVAQWLMMRDQLEREELEK